jgi:hypothetical protein
MSVGGALRLLFLPLIAIVRWTRRRITRRRVFWTLGVTMTVLVVCPSLFIATQCYGNGAETAPAPEPPGARDLPAFARPESNTFLTLPEWFIVYSADEYARFVERGRPSAFPYVGSIGQYWQYYRGVCSVTSRAYPFEGGYHTMLGVIGTSFTVEYLVKGLYEKTIGRLTEWVSSYDTPEDAFAARTAREYGAFMHTVPWYEFPFGSKLTALWRETPFWGPHFLRKMERRAVLTAEYGTKAVYGWLMGLAVGAAYAPEDLQILVWIGRATDATFSDARVQKVKQIDSGRYVVRVPRYEAFTQVILGLIDRGVTIEQIAGNDDILMTAISPGPWREPLDQTEIVAALPILTEPPKARLALRVRVAALHDVVTFLRGRGVQIEHLYDY